MTSGTWDDGVASDGRHLIAESVVSDASQAFRYIDDRRATPLWLDRRTDRGFGRPKGGTITTRRALAMGEASSEAVYQDLWGRIMTFELVPGQWLTERRSAVELGLGLPPVRDALTRLVQDGLLHVVPHKGYRIAELTPKSAHDLYLVWAMLGPEIAGLGTSRAAPEQVAELRRLMAEGNAVLAGPLDREGVIRFTDISQHAFDLLAVASGNDRLVEVFRSLAGEINRLLPLILTTADSVDMLRAATAMWDPAVDRRDAATVMRVVRECIESGLPPAIRALRDRSMTGDGVVLPPRVERATHH